MNLGILTFHSQLNYGGVLQCWALQQALTSLLSEELRVKECKVVVVDRWLGEKNAALRGVFVRLGWRGWIKLFIRGLLGCGDFGKLSRTIRTIRFVNGLNLSKRHFYRWEDCQRGVPRLSRPAIAGELLDILVVGSDQVWHCGDWGDPRPYLLEGAPEIRAISYAASFGMTQIPTDRIELYKRGLGRFAALSCREKEGVELCRGLGYAAKHVVDPTLLLESSQWNLLLHSNIRTVKHSTIHKLVCYFMDVDLKAALPKLERFAAEKNCRVEVLTNDSALTPMPRSIRQLLGNFRGGRVKICRGYGPKEFVRAFASATWTLTDSFHAVMFSSIFNCNARFLRPANEMRKTMFARIEEFAKTCINGSFFVDDVAQALSSFARGETIAYDANQIAMMRAESLAWLANELKG